MGTYSTLETTEKPVEDSIETMNQSTESTEEEQETTKTRADVLHDIIFHPVYVLPNRWNN